MPQLLAPIIASATGLAATSTAVTVLSYVGYTAISAIAMRALAPSVGEMNKGTIVNSRTATGPHEYVYGTIRKGGVINYIETSGDDNTYLHMVIVLTGQPVDSITSVYINDEIVTIDGSNNVTSDRWLDEDGNPTIRIKRYTGSQTTADSDLVAETSVDSTFIGRNCAYLYVRMKYDQNVFSGGIPTFTAVVKGIKPHDPRTSTSAWSDNAALCIRDYIVSAYGLSDADVDDTYFSAAANDCDDLVATAGGGTQKRYRLNGVVNAQSTIGTTLQDMLAACNGTLFFSGGKWKLKVGVYDSSVKTFTLDDLRSEINLPTRSSRRDNFNEVVGKFIDADQDWIEADYPAITSSAFLAEDNNDANTLDLSLNMVTDGAQAQRIAKQTLFRAREQMTFDAEFSLAAMGVEVGDTVSLTIAEYGWTAKTFQVSSWRLLIGDNGVTVSMTLRETSAAAFAWDAEEADIISNNTTLPSMRVGISVNNLTASGGGRTQTDGTFINSVILSWTAASNSFVSSYDVEWKPVADSTYNATKSNTNSIELAPLIDGVQYIIRVRAVTVSGVVGSWASVNFTGGGDTIAPSAPTNLSVNGTLGGFDISWDNPADRDFNFANVYESSDNNFANASLIGTSGGSTFQRRNLAPLVTKYYWVSAVDFSGNEGDTVGPEFATSAQITVGDIGPAVIAWENLDATSVTTGLGATFVDIADYNITVDYQQQLEDATNQLATDALALALNASSLESRINDAGIVVDPATGSVTIQGLSAIEDRVTIAEIDLDAVEGQLSLKATTAYVDSAIAAATLPEATVAELENTIARVDTAEIEIDALQGAITLTSTGSLYNVNDGVLGVEALEGRLTVAEGQIDLKATQTELDDVDTRLTSAEVAIASLDVAEITFAVSDVRAISEKQDDLGDLALAEVLGRYEDRKFVTEDLAFVRQQLTADVNDQREALASATLELGVAIDANTASIVSEQTARANADSALASDITILQADVGANSAAILTEQTARATADTALANSITALQTDVDGNTAAIQTEATARSSADDALASSITALTTTVNNNTSAITTEATTRATADSALASSIASLTSTVNSNTAAITSEAATRASADSALSSSITSLTSTVNNNTTTISTVASSVDGIEGKYGVTIDNNGNATGFQLLSGVGGSAFNVRADQFAVFDSSGNGGVPPFSVFTTSRTIDGVVYPAGTYIKDAYIDNAAIVNASVGTLKVAGNAITSPYYFANTNTLVKQAYGVTTPSYSSMLNFTVTTTGSPMFFTVNIGAQRVGKDYASGPWYYKFGTGSAYGHMRIRCTTTGDIPKVISYSLHREVDYKTHGFTARYAPSAGTYSFAIEVAASDGDNYYGINWIAPSVFAIEVKR